MRGQTRWPLERVLFALAGMMNARLALLAAAGKQALSPDARATGRRESLKIHATRLSKEVTV
jgi:hypothetical protein